MINDLIGKPFESQARGPDSFDCWGLVKEVYSRYGLYLPDYSISAYACDQIQHEIDGAKTNQEWEQIKEPTVPCLVLLKGDITFTQHIGIYVGKGKFLHASSKHGVCIERLESPIWKRRFRGFWQYAG